MFRKIKSISFFILSVSVLLIVSCLPFEEEEPRTLEIELEELELLISGLISKGYDIDTTELGVYYVVYEEGSGPNPLEGDTLSIEYIGTFTDGSIFDASLDHWENGIWEFTYLEQQLIPGFDNALSVMKKGGEIDAIIPSSLAYGITGSGIIPPYTTLIFNLKLNDLKPKSD